MLERTTREEEIEIGKEIEQLESILKQDVVVWEKRLKEVNRELSGR